MKKKLFKLLSVFLVLVIMLNSNLLIYASSQDAASDSYNIVREHTFIVTPDNELIEIAESLLTRASEERVVLGSYTLSKSQTKDLANKMRIASSPTWSIAEFLLGLIGGIPGATIGLCTSLARNSLFKSDVIYAADNNMRVKITITDSKYNHTSYSIQIKYTVVS